MAFVIADRVKETSTTVGTGTLSLAGAVVDFDTFVNRIGNGNTTAYLIDDGVGNWELTYGVVTSGAPATISRGTLIASSTGSRVNFSSASKTIAVVAAAELLLWAASSPVLAETTIASGTTTDLGSSVTMRVEITGTTTITSFGTQANSLRIVRFSGALTLTHNASSLILRYGQNRKTVAGDVGIFVSDGSGNWRELTYHSETYNTWTPSVGGSATYTSQSGAYIKIGQLVYFECTVIINAIGTGSQSQITGFPFTASGLIPLAVFDNALATNVVSIGAYLSGSTITLTGRTAAAASCTDGINAMTSGSRVQISGWARVA